MNDKLSKVLEIIEQKGVAGYEISQNTSISQVGADKIISRKTLKPRGRTVDEIYDYLIGRYYSGNYNAFGDPDSIVIENDNKYQPNDTKAFRRKKKIPIYEGESSGSFVTMFDDNPLKPRGYIEDLFDDSDFAYPIWGNSMFPAYTNGEILVYKEVFEYDEIMYGEAYMVLTNEMRSTKFIRKSELGKEYIKLVPDNLKYYDPVDLLLSKVIRLYKVTGKIVKN